MMRIKYQQMYREFLRVLLKKKFEEKRAALCARLFADSSRDGVYSHGLNRFPLFIEYIDKGFVRVDAQTEVVESFVCKEIWDGNQGPGNINAWYSMQRAIALAKSYELGCVALRNTNHWMRGGSYGWQAADAGVIGICWTNTLPNMPPWGGIEPRLGNNPMVIAVPRDKGHVVLDMAMSQFSYGSLETYRLKDKLLPVIGGYNTAGELTRIPESIEESGRALPVGFWKGSGLSLMLDILASLLSGGDATWRIGEKEAEYGLSQVFIAFRIPKSSEEMMRRQFVDEILKFMKSSHTVSAHDKIFYPGEKTLKIRQDNMEKGVPVNPRFWRQVLEM